MRKLASIQRIKNISPIPGADAIEKLEILGWELLHMKNDFQVGDLCVYVEIDSVLPDRPEFEFMRPRKFRVKTIKMRGQISQGIPFNINVIKLAHPDFDLSTLEEDQDVTELLGITKWDPEQESLIVEKDPTFNDKNRIVRFYKKYKYLITKRVRKALGMPGTATDAFPSYVPKTDETRVQTMHRGLDMHQGKVAYITEKLEGSSTTYVAIRSKGNKLQRLFVKQPMKFITCSRNKIINNRVDDRWFVAGKYDLENKLTSLKRNIAIQGELIGPKVQGNLYELPEKDFRMYLAYDIDNSRYLNYNELLELSNNLQVPMVPVLDDNHIVHTDIRSYVDLSLGNSQLNNKKKREGVVIRLKDDNFSFKSINPEYLLAQKD
jgi:RNA ligase (TIGR02306 family)